MAQALQQWISITVEPVTVGIKEFSSKTRFFFFSQATVPMWRLKLGGEGRKLVIVHVLGVNTELRQRCLHFLPPGRWAVWIRTSRIHTEPWRSLHQRVYLCTALMTHSAAGFSWMRSFMYVSPSRHRSSGKVDYFTQQKINYINKCWKWQSPTYWYCLQSHKERDLLVSLPGTWKEKWRSKQFTM